MTSVFVQKVNCPDLFPKNPEPDRLQFSSLHNKVTDKNEPKFFFLKDLKNERRTIKTNRYPDNSPNFRAATNSSEPKATPLIYKEKWNSFEKSKEIFKREELSLDQKHTKMSDLEALEEEWKQMKFEHEQKLPASSGKDLSKTKNFVQNYQETSISNPSNNPKILRRMVPRSKINLQIPEDNIFSRSLNETDFLKSNSNLPEATDEGGPSTFREFNSKEIESILQLEVSMENERKSSLKPAKPELKNQLYMKTIFDKYSNIYQKKVPEASKIG